MCLVGRSRCLGGRAAARVLAKEPTTCCKLHLDPQAASLHAGDWSCLLQPNHGGSFAGDVCRVADMFRRLLSTCVDLSPVLQLLRNRRQAVGRHWLVQRTACILGCIRMYRGHHSRVHRKGGVGCIW